MTGTNANQSFTLDLTDNRTNTTWTTIAGAAQTTPASIDPGSNRLTNDGISYNHDAAGNRTSQTRGSSTTTYTIDAFNRITQATRNSGATYESPETGPQSLPAGTFNYQINALDERIKKTAQATTTDFVWASPGQLLAEKSGTQWSDHVWLNGELVAMVRNGHLRRPQRPSRTPGGHHELQQCDRLENSEWCAHPARDAGQHRRIPDRLPGPVLRCVACNVEQWDP